jgi:hypothetical protein
MKAYGEVELLLHSFLNLDLGKSECLLYAPAALLPRKEPAMLSELETECRAGQAAGKEVSNSEE